MTIPSAKVLAYVPYGDNLAVLWPVAQTQTGWFKASSDQSKISGSWRVDCNPCQDRVGTGLDTSTTVTVDLLSAPGLDPKVFADDVIFASASPWGEWVGTTWVPRIRVASGYDDAYIGACEWQFPVAINELQFPDPRPGWQAADGTNGTLDLRARFVASYKAGDGTFGSTILGGALTHSHTISGADTSFPTDGSGNPVSLDHKHHDTGTALVSQTTQTMGVIFGIGASAPLAGSTNPLPHAHSLPGGIVTNTVANIPPFVIAQIIQRIK